MWVNDEVMLAVQKGYEIVEIFEEYEYGVTHYDPQTGQGGLFVEYIDTFFKLKTQASGNPNRVRTSENEDRYNANFFASDSIRLHKEAIRSNAANHGLA